MSQIHLKDLFKVGQDVTLEVFDPSNPETPIQIPLYFRKPTVGVMDEIMAKARAKQARARRALLDPDNDDHIAIVEEINQMGHDELVDSIVSFEESNLRRQANSEILYGVDDQGSHRWGKDGQEYLDLLEAVQQRREEIISHNESLGEGEQSLKIDIAQDEEYVKLTEELARFDRQVDEMFERLMEEEKTKHRQKTVETLRKELIKRMVDTKSALAFWQEYRVLTLFHATRMPDDHTKLYFESPDDILDLPDHVRSSLFALYDDFEQDVGDVKNSPSPPHS